MSDADQVWGSILKKLEGVPGAMFFLGERKPSSQAEAEAWVRDHCAAGGGVKFRVRQVFDSTRVEFMSWEADEEEPEW